MPALVAPGICRYSVHGTYSGRKVVNILDMKIDTTGSPTSRHEAIHQNAEVIIDGWCQQICGWLVVDNYVAQELQWMDLDSLDGEVASETVGNDEEFPRAGTGAQTAMPGNVAIRVNKMTAGGRGTRKGRMYLCGLAENQTSDSEPNSMDAAAIAGANAKLASFLTTITTEEDPIGGPGYTSQLHVVHTLDGAFTGSSEVTALTVDPVLGSQRRRLRG